VESITEPPIPDQISSVPGKEGIIVAKKSIENTVIESRNLSTTKLPITPDVDIDSTLLSDTGRTISPMRNGKRLFAAKPILTEANLDRRLVSNAIGSSSTFHLKALIKYPSVPTNTQRNKYQRFALAIFSIISR
jgi:hypothetical protein